MAGTGFSLYIESEAAADGWFHATSTSGELPFDLELEWVLADEIAECLLNGLDAKVSSSDEGSRASLEAASIHATNHPRFRPACRMEQSFVWLQGRFRVCAIGAFSEGPGETIKTDGPFRIEATRDTIGSDLIADGFPFLSKTLIVECKVVLPYPVSALELMGGTADAVQLTIDGTAYDWI